MRREGVVTAHGGSTATVTLRRGVPTAIRHGHPWLYADAVQPPAELPSGTVVDVVDGGGRFVARGLWDPDSPIAVRIWTTDRSVALDANLLRERVRSAWALRQAALDLGETNAFRLLHGEGDFVPGLVCDVYADTAVVQVDTAAVKGLLPTIGDAVVATVPGVRRVLHKLADRLGDGSPTVTALVGEVPARPPVVREHGLRFEADVVRGHKTGLYLDQRDNRALVRSLAAGRRVLNLFSYTGGFAIAAAAGGATGTVSVDIGQPVLDAARRNFGLNDLALGGHELVTADVFAYLTASTSTFDLVILDPPSMAASAGALPGAVRAYGRLNTLALQRVAAGGLLLSCSCSSHVSEADLLGILAESADKADRRTRVVALRGAGGDHPVVPAFPEGRYLKAILAYVD